MESNAEEENVADEIHVGMNEEEYAEKKEMYENIKRIDMSVYIDYEFIEAKHEILRHNIITEPKDANENALLKEALKENLDPAVPANGSLPPFPPILQQAVDYPVCRSIHNP